MSVTKQGLSAIVQTEGNDACHVILRGGKSGTNFDAEAIKKTAEELQKVKLAPVVMVDCSHGNSSKDHKRQPVVAQSIVSHNKDTPGIISNPSFFTPLFFFTG